MSRNLVYLNGQNESITFETGPYLIVKIEGLGIPNVDRQEQKAPYQDGTTYIDSLLQNRDIVVELAITKPNDFPNIALYRRELSQRLCPKYGLGTLTYTDEDNNSYNIRAVVSSMVFPNKDFRDPYMRAMVTFTACDPYWKDTTTDTISLPTSVTSAESVVNGAATNYPSVIELPNGNLFIVYIKVSNGYLVSRTYTTSWSGESVINAASSLYPSIIELSNGDLYIVYTRVSDSYLVSRTYTTGWSGESVVNSVPSFYPCVIELSNGNLFVAYRRASDNYLVSKTYTTSWSGESVINNDVYYSPSVIELPNGNLFIAYRRVLDGYLVSRTYTTSWSGESIINAASSYYQSIIRLSNGNLFVAYRRASDNYLVSRTYTTSWDSESIINAASSNYPSVIELSNGNLYVVYQRISDSYLVSVTRSVTPVPAVVTGDVPAPFVVTFNGPSVNPRIINQDTLEYIRLNTTLAASDSFEVDTTFGNKTVKLTQGGIVKNGIAFLDIGSTFFQLARPTLPNLPVGVNPYRGLKAYYAMQNISEIPDDPAGVTYLQDAWATVDGWNGGGGGATSFGSGNLIFTHTGANQYVTKSISFASGTWRLKVRLVSGTLGGNSNNLWLQANFGGIAAVSRTIATDGSWSIVDVYFASAITSLQFFGGLSGLPFSSNYVLEIDFIYIGTGAYLPNSLLDSSGNSNHGTILGATPDGEGGLAFDGVNDYCSIPLLNLVSFSESFHVRLNSLPTGPNLYRIRNITVATGSKFLCLVTSTGRLQVNWFNSAGSTASIFTTDGFISVATGYRVVVTHSGSLVHLYINGALIGSLASTLIGTAEVASRLGSGVGIDFTHGTIRSHRIYNRALSAEEVLYLYNNPDVAIPTDATVVYFEDDSVASTATATMEWTERYVGL